MASLAVARYIQEATGISIKRVIRALKPLQDVTINLNGRHLTAADPLAPEPKTSSPPSTSQQGTKRALKGTKTVQLRSVAVVPGLLTASVPLVGPLRGVTAEGPFCR